MVSGAKNKVRADSDAEDYTPGRGDLIPGKRKVKRKRGKPSSTQSQNYVSVLLQIKFLSTPVRI